VTGLEIVQVQIYFDANQLTSTFTSQAAASEWIISTLADLLREHGMTTASRIEIRRAS
jgi:hypothetical protein